MTSTHQYYISMRAVLAGQRHYCESANLDVHFQTLRDDVVWRHDL